MTGCENPPETSVLSSVFPQVLIYGCQLESENALLTLMLQPVDVTGIPLHQHAVNLVTKR